MCCSGENLELGNALSDYFGFKYGTNPDDMRLLRDIASADQWWVLVLKRYRLTLLNRHHYRAAA